MIHWYLPMEAEYEQENEIDHNDVINAGEGVYGWEIDEYPHSQRSRLWYILCGLGAFVLIIYAIATSNFLFAVIVLMMGIITLISTFKHPDRIPVVITTTGIVINNDYYDYRQLKNFSLVYNPPEVKTLYIDFHSTWQPVIAIPLEDADPLEVRECLLPYCIENLDRTDESLTDITRRLYKL